jgi:uncharacterized protein with ParB-like and HNH nuclease domain
MSEQENSFHPNEINSMSGITSEGLKSEMKQLTKKINKPSESLTKIMLTAEKIKKAMNNAYKQQYGNKYLNSFM